MTSPEYAQEPAQRSTVGRRTLVKGMAWSTPVIAVSTAAPAMAVSPEVRLTMGATTGWNKPSYFYWDRCSSTSAPVVWDGRAPNSNGRYGDPYSSWSGVFFPDATSNTRVTALTVSVWMPRIDMTLAVMTDMNWTAPTRTGATATYNGARYYEYRATYTGTTPIPYQTGYNNWMSAYYGFYTTTCYSSRPYNYFRTSTTATINGVEKTYTSGWARAT